MSKYTTQVRYICEYYAGLQESTGFENVEDVIKQAIPNVFDFDFPIFDENYRTALEFKILQHYYTREIGMETVGLWKLKLKTKLQEIMPYYNQLYKSELLEFNPLYDVNYTRSGKRKEEGNSAGLVDSNNEVTGAYSDTPQNGLQDVMDLKYLTNATFSKDNGSSNSKGNYDNLNEYSEAVMGKMGGSNYSQMLLDFRNTFLNIDMLVVNDLHELFMGVY